MVARTSLFAAVTSLLAIAVGCGGGGSKPSSTPSGGAVVDAGPESFGEVNPADLAELDAGGAKPADSGSAAPAASGAAPAPEKEDCTSVGVEYEKRVRPQLKACYAEGKKKDPNLQGTVRITIDISIMGKVKSIKITEKTLPDPVAQCMLKIVKTTPLTEADKCWGKSMTIPMTFPTPH